MLQYMQNICVEVCHSFDADLQAFDGESDHVHLMIQYPPKLALSMLVHRLKGVSSRMVRETFTDEIRQYYWKGVLWSPSYFASSCGGAPLDIIREYIQNQQTPN